MFMFYAKSTLGKASGQALKSRVRPDMGYTRLGGQDTCLGSQPILIDAHWDVRKHCTPATWDRRSVSPPAGPVA